MKDQFSSKAKSGAIFIMPRSSKAWLGSEALWITVAGWSAAAKRLFGNAWVVTQDIIAAPADVLDYPRMENRERQPTAKGRFLWIPLFLKTFVKDILLWRQSKRWHVLHAAPWHGHDVQFIWEQHDLFPGPGRRLADQLKVPLVKYVHAPQVWESARWGVKRYVWGWFLERWVEAPALKKADLVACVSQEVAAKVVAMGVSPASVVVSPMAVDPHLFEEAAPVDALKQKLGLDKKFVVGWTGSFRSFHGLDLLIKAFRKVKDLNHEVILLLVGDGIERPSMERLVSELGLQDHVIFTGRQPFSKVPEYVSLFDIAVVSARSAVGFHYSPLKLREYLAARKATLAPNAGEIGQVFTSGKHLVLYEAGNVDQIAERMTLLMNDADLRMHLMHAGHLFALSSCTWDIELDRIVKTIKL